MKLILSISDEIPPELFDPVSWRDSKWTIVSAAINELVENGDQPFTSWS